MNIAKKSKKLIRTGFKTTKTKSEINIWRFIFNALEETTSREQMFFIELEFLNPNPANDAPVLGFKPRVKIKQEDLQFVLAGSSSAKLLETESLVVPSYCAVRIGKIGVEPGILCSYFSYKDCTVQKKPFEIKAESISFTENSLTGTVIVDPDSKDKHPEFMCDSGTAGWNLKYNLKKIYLSGYDRKNTKWFPCGLLTSVEGTIDFNNQKYKIIDKLSYGYSERYIGKSLPKKWFHISSNNLTSKITGNNLLDSSFSVQGVFDDKIVFAGCFEGIDIDFSIKSGKAKYSCVWDCVQTPENGDEHLESLHWSVSVHNKEFVVDVDAYCNVKDLFNKKMELPEGKRKLLSILEGFNGTGEIKIYKKIGKTLEQIEFAKIEKTICEFGEVEIPD